MTVHPCHGDSRGLIDYLTALPAPTPLETCCLHVLIDQADIIDRAGEIMERFGRTDKQYRASVRDDRTRTAAKHRDEVDHLKARIATLTRQLAEERATHA